MKKLVRTEAVVLRLTRFKESSDVVSLLTRDEGRLKGVAKGRRRPRSRLRAPLELFTYSEVVLYLDRDRELQIIKEAKVLKDFDVFRRSHSKFLLANEIALFLEKYLPEHQPVNKIFNMTLKAFLTLESCEVCDGLVYAFKLKGMAFLGHKPVLDRCVLCGAQLETFVDESQEVLVDFVNGGVVCPNCARSRSDLKKLSPSEFEMLRSLMLGKFEDIADILPTQNVQETVNLLVKLMETP